MTARTTMMIILIDISTVILTATPLPPQLPPRIPVLAEEPVLSSVSNSTPADLEECATAEPADEPVEEGHVTCSLWVRRAMLRVYGKRASGGGGAAFAGPFWRLQAGNMLRMSSLIYKKACNLHVMVREPTFRENVSVFLNEAGCNLTAAKNLCALLA